MFIVDVMAKNENEKSRFFGFNSHQTGDIELRSSSVDEELPPTGACSVTSGKNSATFTLGTPLESPMDEQEIGSMSTSSSLHSILSSIIEERNKSIPIGNKFQCEDDGFTHIDGSRVWVRIFEKHFIDSPDDRYKDDMLFYVRKNFSNSEPSVPQVTVEVYRKVSQNKPSREDLEIDWEETTYLNLILQHFEYYVTCAICTRTGDKELQVLKKFTQRVYASPSKRNMENKGTEEEITYPNIFFTIDNFEEAFADMIVRDSEMVCVELVAKDRHGQFQGVIFLGSIRYDALKKVYDTRASLSHRMAQKMVMSWFKDYKRVEFVRMRGPNGKGHAEMAVSRVKGSGPETPSQTPSTENFPVNDFEQQDESEYTNRRMSDPSTSWHYFLRGSLKRTGVRRTRTSDSNSDISVDHSSGCAEVTAGNIEDEFDENADHYGGFLGKSFGQAWHWFKENRRANCVALHSFLTYVTLPWHLIIADLLDEKQQPIISHEILP